MLDDLKKLTSKLTYLWPDFYLSIRSIFITHMLSLAFPCELKLLPQLFYASQPKISHPFFRYDHIITVCTHLSIPSRFNLPLRSSELSLSLKLKLHMQRIILIPFLCMQRMSSTLAGQVSFLVYMYTFLFIDVINKNVYSIRNTLPPFFNVTKPTNSSILHTSTSTVKI